MRALTLLFDNLPVLDSRSAFYADHESKRTVNVIHMSMTRKIYEVFRSYFYLMFPDTTWRGKIVDMYNPVEGDRGWEGLITKDLVLRECNSYHTERMDDGITKFEKGNYQGLF
jgi:hypothetical protein